MAASGNAITIAGTMLRADGDIGQVNVGLKRVVSTTRAPVSAVPAMSRATSALMTYRRPRGRGRPGNAFRRAA